MVIVQARELRNSSKVETRVNRLLSRMASSNSKRPMPESPSSLPRVAVIVLTWNGKTLTLDCLKSLARLEYENVEVIVVDNASTDGTVAAVRDSYPSRVTVIENSDNLGFSRGNNVGIQYALQNGADYILLLNNDTEVDPGLIGGMLNEMTSTSDIGVAGAKIYYASPADQIWFAGGEVFLSRGTTRHIGIRERDTGQFDIAHDVDYVTGCALMTKREVLEEIGALDPTFVAYYEDVDFCMRARRAGYRVVYAPAGKVWHKISSSTGGQASAAKISRKLSSTLIFFRRYASWYHWLTIPFFFGADVIRILFLIFAGRIRDTGATVKSDN